MDVRYPVLMFDGPQFLALVSNAVQSKPAADIAQASIKKMELKFRDIVKEGLTEALTGHLVKSEWKLPAEAVAEWDRIRPVEKRSRGFVDLAVFGSDDTPLSSPVFAAEFKFWYWFDALEKGKYADSGRKYNHLISKSFEMDATKLLSSMPRRSDGRAVVTIISTFHVDQIEVRNGESVGDYLIQRGFPKSYVGLSGVNSKEPSLDISTLRSKALAEISDYFNGRDCPTVVGGNVTGTYSGLTVTTDFVVSEIPTTFTARQP